MLIINSIDAIPSDLPQPIALTIGIFDGMHLGHQAIINSLLKKKQKTGTSIILTFINHPSHIITPKHPILPLISFEHRLELFKRSQLDIIIALPFTYDFAAQSYQTFLSTLKAKLPFSYLILGEDAALGNNRTGNAAALKKLSQTMGFQLEHLKIIHHYKTTISSQNIRAFLQNGHLKKAKKLLGRNHSIWASFELETITRDQNMLFKWEVVCHNLCPIPSAVYGVNLESQEDIVPAIAFVKGEKTLTGSQLKLTIYFETLPKPCSHLMISFMKYLHNEIKPKEFECPSFFQSLSIQPSPL